MTSASLSPPLLSKAPLYWLALGTFAVGTEGFMIAPLLPNIASDLSVSVTSAGQLVTVFALAYAGSSPLLTTLTAGARRRGLLIFCMAAFGAANLLAWSAQNYWELLGARILLAFAAGLYVPNANALAGALVPAEQRGRALAFAGVNPHMGEAGIFGDEDYRLVMPAVLKLNKEGIALVHAPADTIFYYAVQKKAFDAVICAYHDQGLIPFKLVAFETGVNVTLGLPIIRTSPDHGTAIEIAGQNKADHRSMLAAVQLACRLVRAKRKL